MRNIVLAVLTLAILACTSGPDIPTAHDTRHWFVAIMTDTGTILRQCVPHESWSQTEPTNADRQQAFADLQVARDLGQTAVNLGVEIEPDANGDYFMTFEEEVWEDVWRVLWPKVKAFKEVAERNLTELREKAREVGCL